MAKAPLMGNLVRIFGDRHYNRSWLIKEIIMFGALLAGIGNLIGGAGKILGGAVTGAGGLVGGAVTGAGGLVSGAGGIVGGAIKGAPAFLEAAGPTSVGIAKLYLDWDQSRKSLNIRKKELAFAAKQKTPTVIPFFPQVLKNNIPQEPIMMAPPQYPISTAISAPSEMTIITYALIGFLALILIKK